MGNPPVKILYITLEYGKEICGGVGRVVNGLAASLEQKIHLDVLLIRNFRLIQLTRFYTIQKDQWTRKICGHFYPGTLIDIIRRGQYDAVHIFHYSVITAKAVKIIKENFPELKIIYSCHSIAKYEEDIRNNHPSLSRYEDFIIRHVHHIHLLNQSSLHYFNHSYPGVLEKLSYSVIPNGIDEDSFQRKDTRFTAKLNRKLDNNGKINILCISRWSWGKGLEYLLDALPLVIRRSKNVQLIIAGRRLISWEYKYLQYLWKIGSKILPLNDHVTALGWLNDQQRNSLMAYADIWVMPSLIEYFPYSILEPMIARVPIISSRVDSVAEILDNDEECLFYNPKDPQQLADKIITLIQNPDLRRKMADKAYQKAKTRYSWIDISGQYLKMYHFVINNPVQSIKANCQENS